MSKLSPASGHARPCLIVNGGRQNRDCTAIQNNGLLCCRVGRYVDSPYPGHTCPGSRSRASVSRAAAPREKRLRTRPFLPILSYGTRPGRVRDVPAAVPPCRGMQQDRLRCI
eukprot:gene8902-biopygen22671